MRRLVLWCVILVVVTSAMGSPAAAQTTVGTVAARYSFQVDPVELRDYLTAWNVWIFDGANGVTFIGDDDRRITLTLPAQETGAVELVGAGDTGLQLYYTVVDAARRRVSVHAYAVPSGQVDVVAIEPPAGVALGRAFADFSASGTALAFALTYEDADPGFADWYWEFFVWQLPGRIVSTLNADSPPLRARLDLSTPYYALVNFYMRETNVEFGLMQQGANPAGGAASLVWDPGAGAVAFGGTAGWPGVALEASELHAYVTFSDAYPACWTGDGEPRPNLVEVFNPNARPDRVVVYNEMMTYVTNEMFWIDNGARLVIPTPDDEYAVMRLLARSRLGAVEEVAALPYAGWLAGEYTARGLPDGLLLGVRGGGALEVRHYASGEGDTPGAPRTIWTGPDTARMVWTTPLTPTGSLPPFIAASPARLAVGGRATINSTAGDPVNLRSAPGTARPWVAALDEGTVVEITGGPAPADGLAWWEVRTAEGVAGWAAEMLRDAYCIRLLVPLSE
ncbi:MAG: SH3 domain-containing protein [Anaerolineae bacterium]|nr:SH3 domain-containing protein [Anaerolineae bacterium]